jgi:ATP-binding cassette subfamily B (MDR/TAP) protein 1
MTFAAICSIGSGVAMPLMNVVFGNLTGSFTSFATPNGVTPTLDQINAEKAQFKKNINTQTLYLVYLFIGRFVLSYIGIFTFRVSGIRISAALRLAYLRALFEESIDTFDRLPAGKVATRITSSSNLIQMGISEKVYHNLLEV